MSAKKKAEIKEYVEQRMQLWEPDLNNSLELQVQKIE